MGPVFFVMAIMGCGDDGSACQAARVEPVHYATAAQCRAALPAALARATDLDFPVVEANCEQHGLQVAAVAGAKRG